MNSRALMTTLAIAASISGCSSSSDTGGSSGTPSTSGEASGSATGSASGRGSPGMASGSGESGSPIVSATGSSSGSDATGSTTGSTGSETSGTAPPDDDAGSPSAPDATAPSTMMDAGPIMPASDAGGAVVMNGGTGASSFHCVNWAVNGDNYQSGPLILSAVKGSSDTYAQVQNIANEVLGGFITLLNANCVRIPINEPTATTSWWTSYKAIIDTATAKGMKVMIGYWVKDSGHGEPYDINAFYSMWQIVVNAYATNPLVYFDICNEPFGYSQQDLTSVVQTWIGKFSSVPKSNVIVPGHGWDDNVTGMGASFPGYLLQLHSYAIGKSGPLTDTAWAQDVASVTGSYANRTIVGEWGDGVTSNFDAAVNNNITLAYVDGVSNQIHDAKMGSGWWPGLWAGPGSGPNNTSTWSMLSMTGSWPDYKFSVQGPSALKRLQHSWGQN